MPPGLTHLKASALTYIYTPAFVNGEPSSGAHTLKQKHMLVALFPVALGSPFGEVISCRNRTACGSLRRLFQHLLTLPHRFDRIIALAFYFVNTFFEISEKIFFKNY